MGLDMYLRGKRYLWSNKEEDQAAAKAVAEILGGDLDVKEISVAVGQWRKANAVHDWFVNECAGGEDDCRPCYVGRDQLKELKDICVRLLASKDPKDAEELLPCTPGFFFGSQEYDGFYWQDLEYTVSVVDKAIELGDDWEFEYQASW
jgi:hypothetical protein